MACTPKKQLKECAHLSETDLPAPPFEIRNPCSPMTMNPNSWTYFPGLQFILAGVVGKTAAFFGVPAMRLALDVLVYMGVVSVFVLKMLVLKDAGRISPWDIVWMVYLVGAIWKQVCLRKTWSLTFVRRVRIR